jgi:hypothetical protein
MARGREFQNYKAASLRAVGASPDRLVAMFTNVFTTAGVALIGTTPVPEA